MKQVESILEMAEDWNFDMFGGPKWPENQVYEAHIWYISKSSSNDYVNQDWCETVQNLRENDANS